MTSEAATAAASEPPPDDAPHPQRHRGFAGWPSPLRLAVWLGGVYLLGGLVQAAAWLLGADYRVFGGDGRELMHVAALIGLTLLAMHDERPLAESGLALTDRWASRGLLGFTAGFGCFAAYLVMLRVTGAFGQRPQDHWYGWLGFLAIVPLALIVGALLQIIFNGYLLGELRRGFGTVAAVIGVAILFALVHQMDTPWDLLGADWQKLAGLGLLAAVLALVRLITGDIVVPGGIFAGIVAADRINRDTGFARERLDPALADVLAPDRDPIRSPVVWGVLAAALIVSIVVLRRRGPAVREPSGGIPQSFKRVYALGMITSAAPLDVWFGRLHDAGWRVPPVYWPRLGAALAMSSVNTVLSLPERLAMALLPARRGRADPLFIVGVHRSGTTHLHHLLSLDEHLVPPRMYQVLNPTGFLVCGWVLVPLMAVFLPWRRPMDGVRYNLFSPNEEEFAIANTCGCSPNWGMTFPRCWPALDRFIFIDRLSEPERRQWARAYTRFVRKLTLLTRRRPVLKSPYNTGRVGALRGLYPQAKFIHLRRDPVAVYRSNLHLERAGHCLQQLQDPPPGAGYGDRFLENFRAMEEQFEADAVACGPDQVARLAYEDLVRDPIGEIRRVYERLDLPFTPRFERRLRRYVDRHAGYRRTRHEPLSPAQRRDIARVMGPFIDRWGYDAPG